MLTSPWTARPLDYSFPGFWTPRKLPKPVKTQNLFCHITGWLPIRFRNLDYFSKLTCHHASCQMGHNLSKFNSTCQWAPSSRWKSRRGPPPLLVLNGLNKPFFHCPTIIPWASCLNHTRDQDVPSYVVGLLKDCSLGLSCYSQETVRSKCWINEGAFSPLKFIVNWVS